MQKRTWIAGAVVGLALAGVGIFFWYGSSSQKAAAQAPRGEGRVVGVTVAKAVKQSVPVRLENLGTVTTMAAVAVKPRIDSEIIAVKFEDGQRVKQGDVLFVLDSRSIETEIRRVEAVITGAEAQFEQASRDVVRYTDLVGKNATTVVTLNNAQTQVNINRALADSNKATLEGLRVQLSYCTIRAPIAGRISMANVKAGNIARQADTTALATINQVAPIYVSFAVPQRNLPDVRAAIMATIRATMPNDKEVLWPGTLVNTALTLRAEDRITIPATALQLNQSGSFVFVVKDNAVTDRPVKIERTVDGVSVVESGLEEGEVVVTDGQLLLSNGTKVTVRTGKAQS
jgi:multidrug efflux system membrane fusion protein